MDIFDKIGKKASETYKVTAEKTGKLAKETKLKIKMNENKSEIDDLYKQIGKKVYEKHIIDDVINIKEDLEEECSKIDALSQEVEDMLRETLMLKDRKQCPSCFEQIEKSAQYCPNCGTKQEEIVESEKSKENQEESEAPKEVEILNDDDKSNNSEEQA